jgi:Holliday junction resolvase RusA-like endonuclease
MTTLTLPWPDRALHPNARVHYRTLARARKLAREEAFWLSRRAGLTSESVPAQGRLHLFLDFYPPDRRRRDDDGLLASMKAARDGVADALGIDDHRFVSHPFVRDEVRKGGEVVIRITQGPVDAE